MFHSLKNARIFDVKDFYCPAYRMYFEHALRYIHFKLSDVKQAPGLGAGFSGQPR
jgi:hypothetical protein